MEDGDMSYELADEAGVTVDEFHRAVDVLAKTSLPDDMSLGDSAVFIVSLAKRADVSVNVLFRVIKACNKWIAKEAGDVQPRN